MLCAVVLQTNAQIESGTKYIGGTIGGSARTTTSDYKTSSFNVQPSVGYFLNSNWMIGLSTEYNVTNAENYATIYIGGYNQHAVTYSLKSTVIKLGPAVRYYYHVSDRFSLFGEGSIGVILVKDKHTAENVEFYSDPNPYYRGTTTISKYEKLRVGLAPGIVYFPTPRIGIELKANVMSYQTNLSDEKTQALFSISNKSEFNATFNLASTSIGAGFYF